MLIVYAAATLLGASLLFVVEPMVAKMALPLLGGSPSVWNTCMMFFQAVLLAGYAYAHLLTKHFTARTQLTVHLVVLALPLAFLPVALPAGWSPPTDGSPIPWLLGLLAVAAGVPFFVLSTTGPLLQRWLAGTDHPDAKDPYFLYAASNLGSLAALLAYPLLVEPRLRLAPQAAAWSGGYAVFAVLVGACGLLAIKRRAPRVAQALARAARVPWSRRLWWVLLAAVPSSAVLGVTQFLTTDVAAVPLLWVIPLALYLATFIVAFSRRPLVPLRVSSVALAILAVGTAASFWIPFFVGFRTSLWILVPLHLATLFAVGLVCHGRLAADRPEPSHLTGFYLAIGVGGVAGGAFNALAAPLVFKSVVEYPLVLLLACFLRPPAPTRSTGTAAKLQRVLDGALPAALAVLVVWLQTAVGPRFARTGTLTPWIVVAVPCLLCLLLMRRPIRFALGAGVLLVAGWAAIRFSGHMLLAERTFFGVYRVQVDGGRTVRTVDDAGNARLVSLSVHSLIHGTTKHGTQFIEPSLRDVPTSYYHRTGPIGEVFEITGSRATPERVAVVGLGAGTLAAYGRPGGRFTFYEIDPAVIRIARDERYFTYLRDSAAAIDTVAGDGRLALARVPDATYGLIVLDAFSSDAIPVHLLTEQAVALYFRKLAPGGWLAIHMTNEHLELRPVIEAVAADLRVSGVIRYDGIAGPQERLERKAPSVWAVLARDAESLAPLRADPRWDRFSDDAARAADPRFLWTDDFSNLFAILAR